MAFNRRGQTSRFCKKNALEYSTVYIALWLSCTSPPSVQRVDRAIQVGNLPPIYAQTSSVLFVRKSESCCIICALWGVLSSIFLADVFIDIRTR